MTAGSGGTAPVLKAEDAGEALWSVGALMVVKVDGETTGGQFALIDHLAPPGYESPYHVHHREDELFYVLDGELECRYGEAGAGAAVAGPNDTVFLPRNVPHGFRVTSDDACRMLVQLAPAGAEDFFAAVGEPAERLEPPPPAEPDVEALTAAADDYGIDVLGPIPE